MSSSNLSKYEGAIKATGFAPGAKTIKGKTNIKLHELSLSKGKWKKRLKDAYSSFKKAE